MRWLSIAVVAALVSGAGYASEQVAESMPVPEVTSPVMVYDLAPPVPALGSTPTQAEVISEIKVDKPKVAQKRHSQKSILSRTARSQMALMVVKQPSTTVSSLILDDDDADDDSDDLDWHRSYSRPKVAKVPAQDGEQPPEISEHAKLRLLMARAKAIEVHQAVWPADQHDNVQDGLSDTVKLRLALARMKAIEAHQKKFS